MPDKREFTVMIVIVFIRRMIICNEKGMKRKKVLVVHLDKIGREEEHFQS
jgi:hypothetical protein